jgi:photosystem II stability/assembly factor-like uncharacterized protein
MCKKILLMFFFLLNVSIRAQWLVQQAPTTNRLYDVYFADSTEGWVTGYDGIFHSTDGGNSWERQHQMIAVHISGLNKSELWATGNRDTLLHTTNGGIYWDKISISEFTDLDSIAGEETIYFFDNNFGWTQVRGWKDGSYVARLLKTTDGGLYWEMRTHPWLSADAYIQFFDSLYGYRTGSSIPFFKTTDGGDTWEEVSWYDYMATFSMQFLTKDIGWISIDGPVLMTAVIKTTDGGENWFWNITFECSDLSTVLFFTDTLNGWVAQWTCLYGGRTEIWHTSDGGSSWDLQFTFSPPFYFRPNKIFFVDSLHGWVVGEHGVILHTSNGGIIPVELISFTAEVIQDGVMLNWTTATETNNSGFEILRKTQNDNEWEAIGFVTGNGTTTESRSYSFTDENVTTGRYKYRLKQIDYDGTFSFSDVVEVEFNKIPEEFRLYQNYPNPFNPSTKIKYTIPNVEMNRGASLQMVTLKIYDILGNEVTTLVNEEKLPGVYEVEFDASSIASGIYLYQLKTSAFVQTNKMILTK